MRRLASQRWARAAGAALVLLALGVAALLAVGLYPRSGAAALAEKLRGLEGRTGLDPLDPTRPLARTEVLALGDGDARVRFTYADGASRDYGFWLAQPRGLLDGGGWEYTGIDRAFAPHVELPGLPFAGPDAPVRIGTPRRLAAVGALAGRADQGEHALGQLFGSPRSLWSPGDDAVLVPTADPAEGGAELWLVPADGGAPRRLAGGVSEAEWSPDGRWVVCRGWRPQGGPALTLVGRDGQERWSVPIDSRVAPPFAAVEAAVLFVQAGGLWRMPLDASPGTAPTRLRDLPAVRMESWLPETPPIAADRTGDAVAYACGPDLCLADAGGGAPMRVALGEPGAALTLTPVPPPPTPPATVPPSARVSNGIPDFDPDAVGWPVVRSAWSPDGQRLAAVWSDRANFEQRHRPRLAILDRSGRVLAQVDVGPNGPVDAPFWTPDGRYLLLRAYPENGRRIVAVEVATGRVFDLSRPGWDAFFSPSPDGARLFLANGRGDFWVAPLERREP